MSADTAQVEQKISSLLPKVVNADGHIDWTLAGEEISPELKVAVIAEKRRRDTQAAYTRTSQQYKEVSAQKEQLEKNLTKYIAKSLTAEQKSELEDLKFDDPDAYLERIAELEEESKRLAQAEKDSILQNASKEASLEAQIEARKLQLEEFNTIHKDTPLTLEMLESEVPMRVVKQLEEGTITFADALNEAHQFIYGNKVVKEPEPSVDNKLGEVGSSIGATGTTAIDEEDEIY